MMLLVGSIADKEESLDNRPQYHNQNYVFITVMVETEDGEKKNRVSPQLASVVAMHPRNSSCKLV